jgi:hypothetical protein
MDEINLKRINRTKQDLLDYYREKDTGKAWREIVKLDRNEYKTKILKDLNSKKATWGTLAHDLHGLYKDKFY